MITISMLLGLQDNMPFGKHKGKRISSLSIQYLNWLANNIDIEKLKERFDDNVISKIMSYKNWSYKPSSFSGKTWIDKAKEDYSSSEQMRKMNPGLWMECYRGDCSLEDWKDAYRRVEERERLGSGFQTTCNGHGY